MPSPLQQQSSSADPGPSSTGRSGSGRQTRWRVAKPTLPYCTQACLLGLVQNGELDPKCPNYALHRGAGHHHRHRGDHHDGDRHALTQEQFAKLVQEQLFNTPGVDCECKPDYRGSVGYPFKITLTDFGYTFVGKAVEDWHHRQLVQETQVYNGLLHLQGTVVPVHLGLIKLLVPYPVPTYYTVLPYMMLMSYAGEPIESADDMDTDAVGAIDRDTRTANLPCGVDLDKEIRRTLRELDALGLYDEDDNPANLTWCGEVCRVMRIDFDRAELLPSLANSHISEAPLTPAAVEMVAGGEDMVKSERTRRSSVDNLEL